MMDPACIFEVEKNLDRRPKLSRHGPNLIFIAFITFIHKYSGMRAWIVELF